MEINDVIITIIETYEDLYEEHQYAHLYNTAELTFNNGYCFEFHNMLKRFYPNATLMMKNDKMCCATLINGEIYDVNGLREDKENFHEATGVDMEYIFKYYGFFSDKVVADLSKAVTKKVLSGKDGYAKSIKQKPINIV